MTDTPKHTKITKYEPLDDGSIKVVTESYFEELASRKEYVVKQIKTNKANYLSDLIAVTDPLVKQKTRELTIRIYADQYNQLDRIVQEYVIKKDDYRKR